MNKDKFRTKKTYNTKNHKNLLEKIKKEIEAIDEKEKNNDKTKLIKDDGTINID